MKVILLKDVANVGKKNDIVETSDGYARNFLIKNKLAIQYSKGSLESLQKRIEKIKSDHDADVLEASLLKKELEEKEYIFHLKSNKGKSFGQISAKQLIDEINKTRKIVNKYMIMGDHCWDIGNHVVLFKLHNEVIAKVRINIIGD